MINGFTPTEKRLLKLLSDGRPHKREELHSCLDDDLSLLTAIQPHVTRLRKRLEPAGETIVCTLSNRTIHYQHVRLLSSPYDGRS